MHFEFLLQWIHGLKMKFSNYTFSVHSSKAIRCFSSSFVLNFVFCCCCCSVKCHSKWKFCRQMIEALHVSWEKKPTKWWFIPSEHQTKNSREKVTKNCKTKKNWNKLFEKVTWITHSNFVYRWCVLDAIAKSKKKTKEKTRKENNITGKPFQCFKVESLSTKWRNISFFPFYLFSILWKMLLWRLSFTSSLLLLVANIK